MNRTVSGHASTISMISKFMPIFTRSYHTSISNWAQTQLTFLSFSWIMWIKWILKQLLNGFTVIFFCCCSKTLKMHSISFKLIHFGMWCIFCVCSIIGIVLDIIDINPETVFCITLFQIQIEIVIQTKISSIWINLILQTKVYTFKLIENVLLTWKCIWIRWNCFIVNMRFEVEVFWKLNSMLKARRHKVFMSFNIYIGICQFVLKMTPTAIVIPGYSTFMSFTLFQTNDWIFLLQFTIQVLTILTKNTSKRVFGNLQTKFRYLNLFHEFKKHRKFWLKIKQHHLLQNFEW